MQNGLSPSVKADINSVEIQAEDATFSPGVISHRRDKVCIDNYTSALKSFPTEDQCTPRLLKLSKIASKEFDRA